MGPGSSEIMHFGAWRGRRRTGICVSRKDRQVLDLTMGLISYPPNPYERSSRILPALEFCRFGALGDVSLGRKTARCRAEHSDAERRFQRRPDMAVGTVKFFNSQKGFGFIQPEDGGKDVFVHISAVERAGMSNLNEGQKLSYEVVSERGKLAAANLQAV
jgi:CspA family cold shock protein